MPNSDNQTIRIQTEDFDPGAEMEALNDEGATGAITSFVGLVRGDDELSAMTLEHYPGFAEREIARHVEEAKTRWPLQGIRIVHRVGKLIPGERIVFVGVASAHRQASFEAAMFLMDYLKTRAPFWKIEDRASGSAWVESKTDDDKLAERWRQ